MKKRYLLFLTFMMLIFCRQNVFAETILQTDVTSASDNCTFLGIEGEYVVQIQDALDRINEIRKEACKEGVLNPSDPSTKLTMDDYVEIKWSSDLEYIARIRAAESSQTLAHARTNGKSIWNLRGPNGVGSYGEVIAWNWSKSMVYAVNQWYEEKADWVNQTSGAVTGHYTQMIDPEHLYVGLGTFCTYSASYYNTTVGEYSSKRGLDETRGTATGTIIQTLEVKNSSLSGSYKLKMTGELNRPGDTAAFRLTTNNLIVLETINWSSSDESFISIDQNGLAEVKKCAGIATITGVDSSGNTYSKTIVTDHNWGVWTTVTEATVFKAATQERTCPSCGKTEKRDIGEKLTANMTLNVNTLNLKTGQKSTALKVGGMKNGDYVKSVTSANEKVVTVTTYTKGGAVTLQAGNTTGTAKLTVTLASGLKKTVSVTVSIIKTKSISVSKKSIKIKKGKTYTLKPTVTPATSQEKVSYVSSNKKIATVSAKGIIKAKKKGTVKITVKSGSKKVVVNVKVY